MEKVKNNKEIIIKIDFSSLVFNKKTAKKMIRKFSWIRRKADFLKRYVKVEGFCKNKADLQDINNQYEFEICVAMIAIQIEDKKERYDYLYDEICYYLDYVCRTQNLCDFKNNQCFAKQNTNVVMGCCHHFPNKKVGILYQKNLIPCEFLSEKRLHNKVNWLQNVCV